MSILYLANLEVTMMKTKAMLNISGDDDDDDDDDDERVSKRFASQRTYKL